MALLTAPQNLYKEQKYISLSFNNMALKIIDHAHSGRSSDGHLEAHAVAPIDTFACIDKGAVDCVDAAIHDDDR